MVSTTESIGRLITNEVLFQAERQLLRGQDQSQEQPQEQPAPSSAPAPISHNDKAVSSVLLTLLDEQLDAAAATAKAALGTASLGQSPEGDPAVVTGRIAAQYAETEAIFRPDAPAQQNPIQMTINQQVLNAAASPELRMAMQSAFASAAIRAQNEAEPISAAGNRRSRIGRAFEVPSLTQAGLGIFAAIAVAFMLIAIFAH